VRVRLQCSGGEGRGGGSKSGERLSGRWTWSTLPGRDEGGKGERDGRTVSDWSSVAGAKNGCSTCWSSCRAALLLPRSRLSPSPSQNARSRLSLSPSENAAFSSLTKSLLLLRRRQLRESRVAVWITHTHMHLHTRINIRSRTHGEGKRP
jgi:hypothetical protein